MGKRSTSTPTTRKDWKRPALRGIPCSSLAKSRRCGRRRVRLPYPSMCIYPGEPEEELIISDQEHDNLEMMQFDFLAPPLRALLHPVSLPLSLSLSLSLRIRSFADSLPLSGISWRVVIYHGGGGSNVIEIDVWCASPRVGWPGLI